MSTKELKKLLVDQQNDRRELIVLRNKPSSSLKKRKNSKPRNQWDFDPFITYYTLNSDEFKHNNLGLNLCGIITRMWSDYLKLPTKERTNSVLSGKRYSQQQKADPSKKPLTGKTLFFSLNSCLFNKFHPDEHYKTIASKKSNKLSVEEKNAYGAVAELQNQLNKSYCIQSYRNRNEPCANENDLSEGEQSNESSANPIPLGEADAGMSLYSFLLSLLFFIIV